MKIGTGKVYSYLRFSDPKQAAGSSVDRQMQYAQRWAAEHGLPLDEALSLRDEGLSAYHQRHVKQGALGAFLRAVDDGRISAGSVLIVEGLDRLSRAEPIQAQAQLAQIINAGITVVTASDGKAYNREHLKAQPMDLVYSLLVMIRAHEESDTKSKRVKAAVRRQCEGWLAGTYRGIIRNGKDPQWVRWNGQAFELIPERAEAVRLAIEMFRLGNGGVRIVRELEQRELTLFEQGTTASSFYKMLKRRDLAGIKNLEVDGEEYHLPGYYPALLSESELAELQGIAAQRFRRRGRGEIPSIITGLGIAFCGYCGAAIVGQNLMSRNRKPDGTVQDGHRRLICCGHNKSPSCPVGGSCSVVPVEKALLTYCSDQMNLTALLSGGDRDQDLRGRLAIIRQRIAEKELHLERVTAALMDDEGPTPIAFVRKARDLEAEIANSRVELEASEREIALMSRRDIPAVAEAWAAIAEAAIAQDELARLQARQLVADTFERIVIYHHGLTPAENKGRTIDLQIIAKSGTVRMLQIDKRTGQWRAEENLPDMRAVTETKLFKSTLPI